MPDHDTPIGDSEQAGSQGSAHESPTRYFITLAQSRFMMWVEHERSGELEAPRPRSELSVLGWAHELLDYQVTRTQITLRKRIEIYRQVSVEYDDAEMLSASNLEALKGNLLRSLDVAKLAFRDHLGRIFAAAGTASDVAAKAMRDMAATRFDASCVGVINTAISVLEAEALANRHRRPARQGGHSEEPASSAEQVRKPLNDSPAGSPTNSDHDRSATSDEAVFHKEDRVWALSFEGKTVHVPDMVGLVYIADLLRNPRVAIEAAQLAGASVESTKLAALPGIPMADETAIKAVRADLAEKKTELAGLLKSDWSRRGGLQEDISKLEKYLGEVETHQGQVRKVAGTAQRSRTRVTNAISRAIDCISVQHPDLGRHLKESIRTGTAPIYAPVELPDWQF